ncbi:MAG: hypothetical protein K6E29_09650 [Cyanobacteria bacterium RUI128]|nr:hypothetical protein [Cyanobacteria bacterium RUI128]
MKELFGVNEMQSVKEILSMLNESDKNEIENMLVGIGTPAVPELVEQLQVVRGLTRGVVAMTLIRIGDSSIDYLKKAAESNKDFEWVAEYLISEIKGSKAA